MSVSLRRRVGRALVGATLGLTGVTALGGEQTARGQAQGAATAVTLAGFTVLLTPGLQADPALQERVLWRLEEQLQEAVSVLPAEHRPRLRQVRIWVDPQFDDTSPFVPTAWYVPLAAFRHQAGSVVLVGPEAFIRGHGRSNLMLHELAHAYDDRVLGFRDAGVRAAFGAARRRGLYATVSSSSGLSWEAYANTGMPEYFAELTVASFGTNAVTPRDRRELQALDPQGHRAVARLGPVRRGRAGTLSRAVCRAPGTGPGGTPPDARACSPRPRIPWPHDCRSVSPRLSATGARADDGPRRAGLLSARRAHPGRRDARQCRGLRAVSGGAPPRHRVRARADRAPL